jgi:hypothetical protein
MTPLPQLSYEMNSEIGVMLAQLSDIPASPMYEVYISQLIYVILEFVPCTVIYWTEISC